MVLLVEHDACHGTQPSYRRIAPGPRPVELRRGLVPANATRVDTARTADPALITGTTAGTRRALRHARLHFLRSSQGGAAVSKTAGRGFDSFRACIAETFVFGAH